MRDYIPDLTERFPEGFGGVDMTPSFYGEEVDWSRAYKEDDGMEIPNEEYIPREFKVGDTYRQVGVFGGVTFYTVKKIDRENKKVLLAEHWVDVDGEGERKAEWHELEVDAYGNELALEWESEEYGRIYIKA